MHDESPHLFHMPVVYDVKAQYSWQDLRLFIPGWFA